MSPCAREIRVLFGSVFAGSEGPTITYRNPFTDSRKHTERANAQTISIQNLKYPSRSFPLDGAPTNRIHSIYSIPNDVNPTRDRQFEFRKRTHLTLHHSEERCHPPDHNNITSWAAQHEMSHHPQSTLSPTHILLFHYTRNIIRKLAANQIYLRLLKEAQRILCLPGGDRELFAPSSKAKAKILMSWHSPAGTKYRQYILPRCFWWLRVALVVVEL